MRVSFISCVPRNYSLRPGVSVLHVSLSHYFDERNTSYMPNIVWMVQVKNSSPQDIGALYYSSTRRTVVCRVPQAHGERAETHGSTFAVR
jgi:hypothetical protein